MDDRGNGLPPLTHDLGDLHLHSTASDGTLAPAEVVRHAHGVGLAVIALTDHDTVAGLPEARAAAEPLGLRVLTGCEFSVAVSWGEAHLLGYQVREDHPALGRFLSEMQARRTERGLAMVAAIVACGVKIEFADVEAIAAGAPIGRPHVARALIAAKVCRTFDQAFDRFLGRGRPAYMEKRLPSVEEVTNLVRSAGGVTSMAHLKDRATKAHLTTFQAQGVDGVEVFHPSHSGPVRTGIERLARELGMLPTGGSDSHGEAAVSPSHSVIGGVRIPMDWVAAIVSIAASRSADPVDG